MSPFNTIVSAWWSADRESVKGVWLRERAMMDLRYWDNHVRFVDQTATFPTAEELAEKTGPSKAARRSLPIIG